MSLLNNITSGRIGRPQKVIISASEGFGKSTLASLFPDPLGLDIEGSTAQLEVRRLGRDVLTDLKTVEIAIDEVIATKPCRTLFLDTFDWLEILAEADVIEAANSSKIKGIEDFGYGKGYTALKERITLFLSKLDRVIGAGIHVVLLAHTKVVKFEPPDGAGPYDRYELKLSKFVAPLVKEWADMHVFGNWRVQVREKEKGEAGAQFKGVGGKERLMHCNRCAAWDAKNRHGMKDVEPWDIATIEAAFKRVGAPWDGDSAPVVTAPVKPVKAPTAKKEKPEPAKEEKAPIAAVVALVDAANEPDEIPMEHPTDPPKSETPPQAPRRWLDSKCSVCGKRQFITPSGNVCENGHGGAAPVEPSRDEDELERVLGPHAEAATAYILDKGKIGAGQTFRDAPDEYKARVLKNPAGFIDAIKAFAKLQPQLVEATA